MKRTATGNGVYKDEQGGLWARPWINKRRTWRRLYATTAKKAYEESLKIADTSAENFSAAADKYLEASCPNKKLEKRHEAFCTVEATRIAWLKQFFGRFKCDEIKIVLLPAYRSWRTARITKGTGDRAVDVELNTLSNVLNYQVAVGNLDFNFIRSGRPRFRSDADTRKSRDVAPQDAESIHAVCARFFNNSQSEVLGWVALFHMFTGCRTSELLRLRLDAKDETGAGFISGNHLFLGRRSKGGVHPWSIVGDEFAEMLAAFRKWHKARFPKCPWFFPGRDGEECLDRGALGHGLLRVCAEIKIKHFTPHGLRSYYVTKRRSDGATDAQIAAEIGDKTVALISKTYGDMPKNWSGGKRLTWIPEGKKAAWKLILHRKPVTLDSGDESRNKKIPFRNWTKRWKDKQANTDHGASEGNG